MDTDFFQRESRLAADKSIGRLTLAVVESGASEVLYSVVTGNNKKYIYILFLEGSDGCFLVFW